MMALNNREWEDLQRDSAIFPAYTDFLFGVDMRSGVGDEPGLHPQLYIPEALTTTPYTNSRPSAGRANNQSVSAGSDGPQVLDLRSPVSAPATVKLIPPETVHPLPAPASASEPALQSILRQHDQIQSVSSAELTRRKLINAARTRAPPAASPTPLSVQQRGGQLWRQQQQQQQQQQQMGIGSSQLPNPFISQRTAASTPQGRYLNGQMGPPGSPFPSPPQSPPRLHASTAATNQHIQHFGSNTTPQAASDARPNLPRSGQQQLPILRPGEIFQNANFATALGDQARPIDIQIAGAWRIMQSHPAMTVKQQALAHAQRLSTMVYQRTQQWQQAHHQAQQQNAYSPQSTITALASSPMQQTPSTSRHAFPHPETPTPHRTALHSAHTPQQFQHSELPPPAQHAITPQERSFIDTSLPQLFAMGITANTPVDPTDAEALGRQQQAQAWIAMFKARLSGAGDVYLNELFRRELGDGA